MVHADAVIQHPALPPTPLEICPCPIPIHLRRAPEVILSDAPMTPPMSPRLSPYGKEGLDIQPQPGAGLPEESVQLPPPRHWAPTPDSDSMESVELPSIISPQPPARV